ncbi:MAG: hypothetical protein ISR48_06490 [Alphaproteobacteria bacterium]|nr:hypothetical protein [Alphaproteobacteria bacterium]
MAKIDATLRAIAAAPFARHTGVEPITGAKDVFRRRFGQLRAVYEIDRKAQTMTVTAITTRGKAYKK